MTGKNPLHAGAWAIWLAAVVASLAVTRNPIYIGLILAWMGVVWWVARSVADIVNPDRAVPLSPLRFGLFVVSVSALFNALMIPVGDHELFSLPDNWPLIGGPFTVEALVYGALNGLVLTGLFAAFLLVNRVLPVREMVRLAPRAYHAVAIVVSIAVTFVPATMRQYQLIREAQAVRGHRITGLRSWLPLIIPLLTGGMERALQLAEAMTARGYVASVKDTSQLWTQAGVAAGLLLFTTGLLLRLVWQLESLGLVILFAGAALLIAAVWVAGRSHAQTVYRPKPWHMADSLAAIGAAATASLFVLPLTGLDRTSIYYYPYPNLTAPTFSLWIGVSTWGLLVPAAVMMVAKLDELYREEHIDDGKAAAEND